MNIKRALKEKNKLIKQNAENLGKLKGFNSVDVETERAYDPKMAMDLWLKGVDDLIELKTKIHRANNKVYDKIFRMAELKSVITQLKQVDCSSGKHVDMYRRDAQPIVKEAMLSLVDRDALVKKFEAEIESIQEELDNFNAKTKI